MIIKYSEVNDIDNSKLSQHIKRPDHKRIINDSAGRHHYKLLSYLSMKFDNALIYEFGTHHGTSSLALSVNKSNKIITYDLYKKFGLLSPPKNIECRVGDIFKLNQEKGMLDADLIFLDVDHLGVFELKVYTYLSDNEYKGILVIDDIVFNSQMKNFWNNITDTKYDISSIGHAHVDPDVGVGAGTGLVDFSNQVIIG